MGPASSVPTGSGPLGFVVSDFNGDTIPDLAVAGGTSRSITIHIGRGDGSFPVSRSYAISGTPGTVLAADFNGDGIADLASPNPQDGVVEIFLGQGSAGRGDGTFAYLSRFAAGNTPGALATGDFNGDGITDLLVANQAVGQVSVLLGLGSGGHGTGAFGPPSSHGVFGVPVGLAVADFNEDGVLDFAVTVAYWNYVAVFLGRGVGGLGDGTFGPGNFYSVGAPGGIQTGDFNSDGVIDLVVTFGEGLGLLFGQGTGGVGDGTFAPVVASVPYGIGGDPTHVAAGDLDGDGLPDLAACFPALNQVRWLRGLGSAGVANGSFTARTVRATGLRPQFIELADFNRDGRLDVGTSNEGSSDISILFGGCDPLPPPAPPLPVGHWTENGVAVCDAPGVQLAPDGAPDGTGGAIFAWADGRSGGAHDIYASCLTAEGDLAPGWTPNGNPVCVAEGIQSFPRVVRDGMGGALVAWLDGRDGVTALYAQHLLSSGAVAPGWPANGLRLQAGVSGLAAVAIDADGEGGAVMAWVSDQGPQPRLFVGRITGSGAVAAGWPAAGIDVSRGASGDGSPRLASDGLGGAYVGWMYSYTSCTCDFCDFCTYTFDAVALARVNGTGVVWDRIGGSYPYGGPLGWSMAGDGAQGVFWGAWRGVSGAGISRIDAAGHEIWGANIRLYSLYYLKAAADGVGGVIFATRTGGTENDSDIAAQRLAADGQIAPGWVFDYGTVACRAPADQYDPLEPVADGRGGAYFGWTDARGGDVDLYASRLDAEGVHASGWSPAGNPVCAAPGNQVEPRMFSDGLGGAIEVWRDDRRGEADVYAQRVGADYPVPAQLSLVHATASPDAVRLTWFAADGVTHSAALYRREPESRWDRVEVLYADGSGRFEYEDRRVRPGARYGYRLGVGTGEQEEFFAETWVDVPARVEFSLASLVPNPALDGLMVSFALPGSESATLELLDVTGRRLTSRSVGGLGPGSHVVSLARERWLAPGIYFIRLKQGERLLTARACVLR